MSSTSYASSFTSGFAGFRTPWTSSLFVVRPPPESVKTNSSASTLSKNSASRSTFARPMSRSSCISSALKRSSDESGTGAAAKRKSGAASVAAAARTSRLFMLPPCASNLALRSPDSRHEAASHASGVFPVSGQPTDQQPLLQDEPSREDSRRNERRDRARVGAQPQRQTRHQSRLS